MPCGLRLGVRNARQDMPCHAVSNRVMKRSGDARTKNFNSIPKSSELAFQFQYLRYLGDWKQHARIIATIIEYLRKPKTWKNKILSIVVSSLHAV
jgi:hypothetical protein